MSKDAKFFIILTMVATCSLAAWFFFGPGKEKLCPGYEPGHSDTVIVTEHDTIVRLIEGSNIRVAESNISAPEYSLTIDTAAIIADYFSRRSVTSSFQNEEIRIRYDASLLQNKLEPIKLEYQLLKPTDITTITSSYFRAYKWQVFTGAQTAYDFRSHFGPTVSLVHNGVTQVHVSYNILDPEFNLQLGISVRTLKWGQYE